MKRPPTLLAISELQNPQVFSFVATQVKDRLLEAWCCKKSKRTYLSHLSYALWAMGCSWLLLPIHAGLEKDPRVDDHEAAIHCQCRLQRHHRAKKTFSEVMQHDRGRPTLRYPGRSETSSFLTPYGATWTTVQKSILCIDFSSIYSLYINNLVVLFRSSAVRISDPDWRVRLANFDNVFKPSSQGEAPAPKPGAENADLSVEGANANATTQGSNSGAGKASEPPPSMSQEDFQKAYPEPTLTISLTVAGGQSITCTYAKGKVFLSSQSSMVVGGIDSSGSKPVLCYAGGSWISDSSKVRLFKLCFGMFMYVFIRLYALFLC